MIWWEKHNRSYMIWELGKSPEVVVEIVSNLKGEELSGKMKRYEAVKPIYYVVFDPSHQYGATLVRFFRFDGKTFHPVEQMHSEDFPLGLEIWEGEYEGNHAEWLRWTDNDGNLIPTGRECADRERERAQEERQRAQEERERAKAAEERSLIAEERASIAEDKALRLAAKLRALGINPENV
jgi:Putative restriction endonuclease